MMESDHNWTSSNWSPMTNKKEPNLLTVMRAIKRFFGTNFWTNLRKKMDKTQNGTFSPWMLIKNCSRPLILHTCKSDLGRWQVELWAIVNHYGCHKGCIVARGHRTETPFTESTQVWLCSEVCDCYTPHSIKSTWNMDNRSRRCIPRGIHTRDALHHCGSWVGAREGHMLIINKAIYGLKSSRLHRWEKYSMTLFNMGLKPSNAEDNIWTRQLGELYELIARYNMTLL